ncbi:MAG: metallophosphoesterase [Treponema sp.]|jgi:3',5'-cyclic AMP phosphodiesterase CpdA|nr:metallophosphoesterase [Treponema sp.]
MKKNEKTAALVALGLICFTLAVCKDEYGLDEFLNRADDVNARSAYIRDINIPVINEEEMYKPNPSGSKPPFGNNYTVLILADIHFGAHPDHPDLPYDEFFQWLEGKKAAGETPAFCLVLGDNAEAGTEEEYLQFKDLSDKLESDTYGKIPVYSIVGNHDLYNNGWRQYTKYCKPYISYYRFNTGNFSWYALDSGSGTLGGSQLKNLVSNLKADPKPKVVFSHYPMYGGGNFYFSLSDPHERAALISAFAKNNVKIVLEGHQHPGSFYDFGSFKEYNVSAFRDRQSWHLLTVDEENETVTLETFAK